LSGYSHQQTGIIPDITLPDLYSYYNNTEKDNKYALPNDYIIKNVTYAILPKMPIDMLSIKSAERIKKDRQFNRIKIINDSLTLLENSTILILKVNSFVKRKIENNILSESFETASSRSTTAFEVNFPAFDSGVLQIDEGIKDFNKTLLDKIQQDIYIEESYMILKDLLGK